MSFRLVGDHLRRVIARPFGRRAITASTSVQLAPQGRKREAGIKQKFAVKGELLFYFLRSDDHFIGTRKTGAIPCRRGRRYGDLGREALHLHHKTITSTSRMVARAA